MSEVRLEPPHGLMTCGNTLGLYSPCVNLKPMEAPACASCWQRLDTRQRGALLDAYRATVNKLLALGHPATGSCDPADQRAATKALNNAIKAFDATKIDGPVAVELSFVVSRSLPLDSMTTWTITRLHDVLHYDHITSIAAKVHNNRTRKASERLPPLTDIVVYAREPVTVTELAERLRSSRRIDTRRIR